MAGRGRGGGGLADRLKAAAGASSKVVRVEIVATKERNIVSERFFYLPLRL